jgi:hypothetical protein
VVQAVPKEGVVKAVEVKVTEATGQARLATHQEVAEETIRQEANNRYKEGVVIPISSFLPSDYTTSPISQPFDVGNAKFFGNWKSPVYSGGYALRYHVSQAAVQ